MNIAYFLRSLMTVKPFSFSVDFNTKMEYEWFWEMRTTIVSSPWELIVLKEMNAMTTFQMEQWREKM